MSKIANNKELQYLQNALYNTGMIWIEFIFLTLIGWARELDDCNRKFPFNCSKYIHTNMGKVLRSRIILIGYKFTELHSSITSKAQCQGFFLTKVRNFRRWLLRSFQEKAVPLNIWVAAFLIYRSLKFKRNVFVKYHQHP